jgi:hypothetical protein
MSSLRAIFFGLISVMVATAALAQSPRRSPAAGFAPQAPKLTKPDVERLVKLLPELARQSGDLKSDPTQAMRPGSGGMGQLPVEDLQRVEVLLKKHGYTFPVFLMQLTALVSTYLALQPEEFDKQLPTESSPEIKKVLDDPKVAQEKKDQLRKQIKEAHANKELIRKQVTAFATEENKKVVRPLLSKVRRALESAEREAKKAREKRGK